MSYPGGCPELISRPKKVEGWNRQEMYNSGGSIPKQKGCELTACTPRFRDVCIPGSKAVAEKRQVALVPIASFYPVLSWLPLGLDPNVCPRERPCSGPASCPDRSC